MTATIEQRGIDQRRLGPDRPALSTRERDVLCLYVSGLPSKSVARRLGIKEGSVKEYLKRVRRKYALLSRSAGTKLELYHRACEDGLVPSALPVWHGDSRPGAGTDRDRPQ
ncbi:response regulator transcription factor [Segeticoccus rhizosphaerae]|uniref:response regulator transcription factor n=1 Tax=Segeticoccus rhizosphaerae TaxID=1104777 RepID=UPI0013904CA4|nr:MULTISPECIES: helix-turn-helix transcriptional regulator [Intrasporangiaceae]